MDYAALPEVQALKAASPDELRSIVIVLMRARERRRIVGELQARGEDPIGAWRIGRVLAAVNKRPPFSRGDVGLLLSLSNHALRYAGVHDNMLDVTLASQPVAAAERAVKQGGVGELRDPIRALAETLGRVRAYGATTGHEVPGPAAGDCSARSRR